ncbi:glycoside hydrolase superfamily [Mycotypha africana]|uniref:glycoside hydrolase superfamily n=1 Tax=Mycotypha africana TaxID=64632 RepID=UPI0023015FEF|nr:glycoside hydrolase superfamily [Mycotypha africana]KAI8968411.1 glycoside hydrolase superfamily [Mycotypha africana]
MLLKARRIAWLVLQIFFNPLGILSLTTMAVTASDIYNELQSEPSIANINFLSSNGTEKSLQFQLSATGSVSVNQVKVTKTIHTICEHEEYELEYTFESLEDDLQLKHIQIDIANLYDLSQYVMMAEGFQCWSTSKEMGRHNRLAAIPRPVAWFTKMNLQGDYDFFNYSGRPGHIHSTGYTYMRHMETNHVVFLGSISEQSGYTYYQADFVNGQFSLYKDIEGKRLKKGDSLSMKFFVARRDDNGKGLRSIWEKYATYYQNNEGQQKPIAESARHRTGWSSWYNFYERVTEQDIVSSLDAFKKYDYPIDVFQIDDGYQRLVGDWLDVDRVKFPSGMEKLADNIKEQGYIPGLWLAPYAVSIKSKIVKEHPEWLLRHEDGSFVLAGPNWGGFYAIDIYNSGARGYLTDVFDEVIDKWGYKLLKLDFLFAAAMIPRLGKSRGEIAWDAINLIQELSAGRVILLGSGVTLPSVWGRFDYSRVSSDASPWWDDAILRASNVRERVSTNNAMTSTMNRWPMAGTVFGSDPDVFFIRSNNNKLTADEKHTLLLTNIIFGDLTLMSDDVGLYSPQEHLLFSSIFPKPNAQVQKVQTIGNDIYQTTLLCNGRAYVLFTNLSPLPQKLRLPAETEQKQKTYYFEYTNPLYNNTKVDWYPPQKSFDLRPHEARLFLKTIPFSSLNEEDAFMGSTLHIVPGTEIQCLTKKENVIYIYLKKPYISKKAELYVKISSDEEQIPPVFIDDNLIVDVDRITLEENIHIARIRSDPTLDPKQ